MIALISTDNVNYLTTDVFMRLCFGARNIARSMGLEVLLLCPRALMNAKLPDDIKAFLMNTANGSQKYKESAASM